MSSERVLLRRGLYADSVTLMQVSREVSQAAGVQAALIGMATRLNLELLVGMGFEVPAGDSPNELFIAVRAADQAGVEAAAALAEQLLSTPRRPSGGTDTADQPPRTIGSAATAARDRPRLALISVPGQHAFTEAMDALDAGCDVLVFSDNVSVADEIRLKDAAAGRGLLVMGPDCGTAVVGRSAWWPPRAPVRSRFSACSTLPGWASAPPSASAAVTSPSRSPGVRRSPRSPRSTATPAQT